jgi:beta-barrel assembly-enhancing protease
MSKQIMRRRWYYPILSLVLAVAIAFGQPLVSQAISLQDLIRGGVQIIQGIQLSNLSDKQEAELGQQINDELTGGQVRLVRDAKLNQYINDIGQRLAAQSDRPNIRYTFRVVDDKSINAFATMGGNVYVHTGLIAAADNEAQLAGVMGHEIGHIAGRHAIRQMRSESLRRGILAAGGLDRSQAISIGVDLALSRPNSRKDEYDADERGLRTMSRAGYAQSEMVGFMKKLLSSGGTPTFLSRHPATSDRITRLNQLITSKPTNGKDGLDTSGYRARIQSLR